LAASVVASRQNCGKSILAVAFNSKTYGLPATKATMSPSSSLPARRNLSADTPLERNHLSIPVSKVLPFFLP
jgi:hypothetical protein